MTDTADDKKQESDRDYEIGYCRPPKDTQFKPGKSGNPQGRKRKPKSVREQMQKVLTKKIAINEGGTTRSIPLQEVILRSLANNAAKGDLKSAAFVFNFLNSPEYADTGILDQTSLSSEDQAMFEAMMTHFVGDDSADDPKGLGANDEDSAASEPSNEQNEPPPLPHDPSAKDRSNGE